MRHPSFPGQGEKGLTQGVRPMGAARSRGRLLFRVFHISGRDTALHGGIITRVFNFTGH